MTARREQARGLLKDITSGPQDTARTLDLIESALADAERAGMEKAAQVADAHTCGGEDDVVCRGLNCSSVIAGLIRKAQAGEEA